MATSNNVINSSPFPDQPIIQTKRSLSALTVVNFILLLLCIVLIIGYITYKEFYSNPEVGSSIEVSPTATVIPTTAITSTSIPTIAPTDGVKTTYQSVDLFVPGSDNSVKVSKFNFSIPSGAKNTVEQIDERGVLVISDTEFRMEIVGEYEDESYNNTPYSPNYKALNNSTYGTFYRVQESYWVEENPNMYTYVNGDSFKSTGTCSNGLPIDPAPAPCGDSFLGVESSFLLSIYCTSQTSIGLDKCDHIVESMKKL